MPVGWSPTNVNNSDISSGPTTHATTSRRASSRSALNGIGVNCFPLFLCPSAHHHLSPLLERVDFLLYVRHASKLQLELTSIRACEFFDLRQAALKICVAPR